MTPEDTATQTINETIPTTWPGGWGVYKFSKNAIMLNVWTIVGLFVVSLIVMAVIDVVATKLGVSKPASDTINNLVSVLFSVAITLATIEGVKRQKIDILDSLKHSLPYYLNALVLTVLTIVICMVSLLLLVVPFFFVAPRISLAMYYLLDSNLGPVDSLKASWQATKGNVGKVWEIIGVSVVFALLMVVLVGIYFLIMYGAASAIIYFYLKDKIQTQQPVVDQQQVA